MVKRILIDGKELSEADRLLTPAEVATAFRVEVRTVTRWARTGSITAIRTPGGHRRYRETEVNALLQGSIEGGAAA